MKLYQPKELKYHFVILCLDDNVSRIRTTLSSIKAGYNCHCSVVVSENVHEDDVSEAKRIILPVTVGGKTVTSLINAGMRNGGPEWNLLVVAGTWVRPGLIHKYSSFVESEKDILFPVIDRKYTFIDGTINGILMHRKTFQEVGDFADDNPLDICKTFWTIDAIEKGCRFKAIVGSKLG